MSWDAGAIVGSLQLNINGYAQGMLQAEGLMHAFGPMVTDFMEEPLAGVVEIAKKAGEELVELGRGFVEMLGEVAGHAQHIGLEAMKSGVSTGFLSDLEEAGKRVGVSLDEISNSFKFLQRNAVSALDGTSKEAMEGFQAVGISAEVLKDKMNDSQFMFNAVREGLQGISGTADRTGAALRILGREGAGMLPMFLMSNQAMQDASDISDKLGSKETDASAKAAQGWFKVTAAIDDMWEGLKKKFADRFVDFMNDHWQEFRQTIFDVAKALEQAIPAAATITIEAMIAILKEVEDLSDALTGFFLLTDKLKLTHGMADTAARFRVSLSGFDKPLNELEEFVNRPASAHKEHEAAPAKTPALNFNVNVNFDPTSTAHDLAAALQPQLDQIHQGTKKAVSAASRHAAVSKGVGGRGPSRYATGIE